MIKKEDITFAHELLQDKIKRGSGHQAAADILNILLQSSLNFRQMEFILDECKNLIKDFNAKV